MIPFDHELFQVRLPWLIRLRWGAVAGGSVLLLVAPGFLSLNIPYGQLGICLLLLGALNGLYLWMVERWRKAPGTEVEAAWHLLHGQMAGDLVLLTVMLALSGGTGNPLFFLYLFHLAISAILFSQWESLAYASAALALPWLLFLLETIHGPEPGLWSEGPVLPLHGRPAVLAAYSLAVMGLWYFLSRLSGDLALKQTELETTGEKLKTANEALRQMNNFKSQFLKQVVAQLKNPVVEMDFDLTSVETALPAEAEGAQAAIQSAKKRVWVLLQLIEDLAWLTRTEAAEVPLRKEWIDVYEAALRKVQALEPLARPKGIEFQLHGDPGTRLLADPEAFGKVLDNLLSNAVKYTPEGKSHVVVEFKPEGDWLVLSVQDEGIGVPAKQQKKLFQQFFRATNAKAVEKFGTGLGLSIVRQALENHGGRVVMSSGPQEGTRVETWWPLLLEIKA
ncbi:MAG TPA: HAMP domain-containing sensor histidine kinase [bacterium]|nr:HAMP domain-containing sensor histidine kinase [bacterium]